MTKSAPFSSAERIAFERMVREGVSTREIAAKLNRSLSGLTARRAKLVEHMNAEGIEFVRPPQSPIRNRREANLAEADNRWRKAAIAAGIKHLIDLKRAGHSPTKTELRISADSSLALPMHPIRAASFSATGSHAAMCAELGGKP